MIICLKNFKYNIKRKEDNSLLNKQDRIFYHNNNFLEQIKNKFIDILPNKFTRLFDSSAFAAFEGGFDELVKNSYDAGAENIFVSFVLFGSLNLDIEPKLLINIEDNGSGFSDDILGRYPDLSLEHRSPESKKKKSVTTAGGKGMGIYLIAKISQSNGNNDGVLYRSNIYQKGKVAGARITLTSSLSKAAYYYNDLLHYNDNNLNNLNATIGNIKNYFDNKQICSNVNNCINISNPPVGKFKNKK